VTRFLELVFAGLSLGAVYSLIALGFVIVFKGSGVFNFAHGEFVMGAAYLVVGVAATASYPAAVGIAIGAMVILALLVERFLLRRMLGEGLFAVVMVTFGLAAMVRAVVAMIWGFQPQGFADPVGPGVVEVGGVVLPEVGLWTVAVTAVLLALLGAFYQRTGYGLALRATAQHQEAALAQGIDVRRMFALSWAIAGVLAVAAGIFLGAFPRQVDLALGFVALNALPVIILGGFDSLLGAVIGGVVVGLAQVLAAGYAGEAIGSNPQVVVPYLIMLVVLVVRPHGLFGTPEIERV
jgi:branched-chain amino acid transport system permease protein